MLLFERTEDLFYYRWSIAMIIYVTCNNNNDGKFVFTVERVFTNEPQ